MPDHSRPVRVTVCLKIIAAGHVGEVGESCLTISPSYFSRKKNSHACISANLDTIGKFDFRYGFVVARIKVPRGQGLVSSFKLLPAGDRLTCDNGEIDIMRITGCNTRKLEGSVQFGHTHRREKFLQATLIILMISTFSPVNGLHMTLQSIVTEREYVMHVHGSRKPALFLSLIPLRSISRSISPLVLIWEEILPVADSTLPVTATGNMDCMIVDYVRLYRKPEYDDFRAEHLNDNAQGTSDASANLLRSNDYFRVNDSYDCSEVLISDNDICIVPSEYQINRSGINMTQNGFSLEGSSLYEFSAEVKADCEWEVSASVRQDNDSFDDISGQITFNIEKEWQTHRFEFEAKV